MMILGVEAQWLLLGPAVAVLIAGTVFVLRAYRRRGRRRALLARLQRISLYAAHQVEVPDGMGGFIHLDHLLLTPRGWLILDTRRVSGLIFGGDQMSEWTVMAGNRRYTFENPQQALYDRIAAVKALVGDIPVEGRLLFSNAGKFTKGKPKYVLMLDGLELEFGAVEPDAGQLPAHAQLEESWQRLQPQLRPSPHLFTSL